MNDATDFLILYDLASPRQRAAMLEAFFIDPEAGQSFEHIVWDPLLRARLEFAHNQAIAYEDYLLLKKTGYVRPGDEFRSRSRKAYGEEFPHVEATDKQRNESIEIPGIWDVHQFFAPFVEAYICRHTGQGIVVSRDGLEVALDLNDLAFLSLVVEADSGEFLFPDIAELREIPELHNHDEMRQQRREKLDWWAHSQRGVEIHDLAQPTRIPKRTPRRLACDQAALAILQKDTR